MEHESFENDEVASVLNQNFIPIKIDREERPDIDRIYMNYVQATTGSGGWPLNVFVTPSLEPVFGGTYWPGPQSHTRQLGLEEQLDFLGILDKLSKVWREQEAKCRLDSAMILEQLRSFAAEGTLGSKSKLGDGEANLDLDLLDDSYQHLAKTFDTRFSGFGEAPKFPTPAKLNFLLRLRNFPQPVIDIVGQDEVNTAQFMALATLRAMDRGGIHDHIGHGFARYSVTEDWSLPHFEKMLYDNAQLLHCYLDAFFSMDKPDAELLGVVYDLAKYLIQTRIAAPNGGFYSSEDADSYYRKGDDEKREGAYYVWTQREIEQLLDENSAEVMCEFFGVLPDGNVEPERDVHDEFINQNVLKISKTPAQLAHQFGVDEKEIVKIIKESKVKLRAHREKERVQPNLDDKIVCCWNGIAIGALARTGAALSKVDAEFSKVCFDAAIKAAEFIRREMYDEDRKALKRVWREGPGDTDGFADDYAFMIDGLIELYETTFDDRWLKWADELQGMFPSCHSPLCSSETNKPQQHKTVSSTTIKAAVSSQPPSPTLTPSSASKTEWTALSHPPMVSRHRISSASLPFSKTQNTKISPKVHSWLSRRRLCSTHGCLALLCLVLWLRIWALRGLFVSVVSNLTQRRTATLPKCPSAKVHRLTRNKAPSEARRPRQEDLSKSESRLRRL